MSMMKAFLEQAAFFYKGFFQEEMPDPRVTMGHEEDPEADPVDAHWKTSSWELLLSLDGGDFQFYGDNLGASKRKVNYADANPKSLALAIYMLSRL
jgi:hypothetical protein